ncbi:MAG: hypothetical protein GY948_07240 [Alphaproteobacteria bacterium]|nr:hypothetical protein [Alphaproteobacteria bacterium]
MISHSPHKKLAVPSVFALLAALTTGLGPAPASAALAPSLGAPTPAVNSEAAPEKAMQMASSTKKKKKKRKKKRRGSYFN